jgi:hypothetical protein
MSRKEGVKGTIMNTTLFNAIRTVVSSQGGDILLDSRRVDKILPVFAKKEIAGEREMFIGAWNPDWPPNCGRIRCRKAGLPVRNKLRKGLSAHMIFRYRT